MAILLVEETPAPVKAALHDVQKHTAQSDVGASGHEATEADTETDPCDSPSVAETEPENRIPGAWALARRWGRHS